MPRHVKTHNKLFKSDSQRVAFLLCVGLGDQGVMRRHRYCVAHTLTGRYSSSENLLVYQYYRCAQNEIFLLACGC
ncbi:DUF3265 domain-containing protein [Vibrio parahaemolyticus]|nr:DUF3265 domain-containing protein [Vibrio parahaemolyticus]EJG1072083.1 DUF3265 domain-containing protein [Vibrio parahaemolyticus]HCG9740501.1 DUF3265 domain-containing protein [Vibrio parahaemolyticus]